MRSGLTGCAVILLLAGALVPAAFAQADCGGVIFGGGAGVSCRMERRSGGGTGEGGEGQTGQRPVDPLKVGRLMVVGALPDGSPCRSVELRDFGNVTVAEAQNRTTARQLENNRSPECPPAPGAPPVVLPSPEEVALAFYEQLEFPAPRPEVAPGWAITGLPAYLEPGTAPRVEQTFVTLLGELTIRAGGADH